MNPLAFLRPQKSDVTINEADLDIRPMSELEHFTSRTRVMIDGLDSQIESLDAEINRMIHHLSDLRRIRAAQALALRHMEGEI